MANRRMFSKDVIHTEEFYNLSPSAQALYFELGIEADDDGVLSSPMPTARMFGYKKEHVEELEKAGFIISFPSGISIIRHWKMNNYLRCDRYHGTVYQDEFSQLTTDNCGRYIFKSEASEPGLNANGVPVVYQRYTEDRLDKVSTGKFSLGEANIEKVSLGENSGAKEEEIKKGCGETTEEGTRAIKPFPKRNDFKNDEEYHEALNDWLAQNDITPKKSGTETGTNITAKLTDIVAAKLSGSSTQKPTVTSNTDSEDLFRQVFENPA